VVSLPRDISPGTAARRSLLADLLAAIALALLAFQLAAGIGVVGFLALLTTVVLLLWIGVEAAIRRATKRRVRRRSPSRLAGRDEYSPRPGRPR
jgi:NhaP-type Na+/H+ or K+/H+ antiporter